MCRNRWVPLMSTWPSVEGHRRSRETSTSYRQKSVGNPTNKSLSLKNDSNFSLFLSLLSSTCLLLCHTYISVSGSVFVSLESKGKTAAEFEFLSLAMASAIAATAAVLSLPISLNRPSQSFSRKVFGTW